MEGVRVWAGPSALVLLAGGAIGPAAYRWWRQRAYRGTERHPEYWGEVEDLETLQWVRQIVLTIPDIKREYLEVIDDVTGYVTETRSLRECLAQFLADNPGFPRTGEAIRLAAKHQATLDTLLPFLRANPRFPQNNLRRVIGISVKEVANLLKCLDQYGFLRREKADRTYLLSLRG